MANYVAHHTKKRAQLVYREEKLLRSIQRNSSREIMLRLAEEVRLARIRVLRAERATFVPTSSGYANRAGALDNQITSLEATTAEEILQGFCREKRIIGKLMKFE